MIYIVLFNKTKKVKNTKKISKLTLKPSYNITLGEYAWDITIKTINKIFNDIFLLDNKDII